MKNLIRSFVIAAMIAVFVNFPAGFCSNNQTYLAVYRSANFENIWFYDVKADLIEKSSNWKTFDAFLDQVEEKAGGRDVILSLSVHGSNYLTVGTQTKFSYASFGWVVNHIESHLSSNVIVLCDACYGGDVYKNTIRQNTNSIADFSEDCDHIPPFPIYGHSANRIGIATFMIRQYLTGKHYFWKDLRDFEREPSLPEDHNPKSSLNKELEDCWNAVYLIPLVR